MNKSVMISVFLVLVIGGFFILSSKGGSQEEEVIREDTGKVNIEVEEARVEDRAVEELQDQNLKIIQVSSKGLSFFRGGIENPDITVSKGELVRIELTNEGGFHDFVIDEFGAATAKISSGGSSFVEFVADSPGTFEYYCSVGSHRAQGMKGNFIVLE